MVQHLEAMIASGLYPSGTRIPSLRELADQFALSAGTVRRGIENLVERGLLEFRHGSGTYVAEHQAEQAVGQDVKKIAVFMNNGDPQRSYCGQALIGMQEVAAANNCSLLLNFFTYDNIHEDSIRQYSAGCAGMILLGCYDLRLGRLAHSIPGVGLSMHHSFGGLLSLVELDLFNAAELGAEFFLRRGKKRLKIISHDMPPHRARGEVFSTYWRQFGPAELQFYPDCDFTDRDCGYWFVSGSDCNSAIEAHVKRHGVTPTDEYCILSVDGKSLFAPGYYPVNTIGADWREAGSVALAECLRRVNQPGALARRIYLDCRLHEMAASGARAN